MCKKSDTENTFSSDFRLFNFFFFLSLHSFYTIRRLQFDELVGFMGANRIYEIKLRAQTHEYALKHVPYIEHPNDIRPNEYVCLYEAMTSSELHTFCSCESSCCCAVLYSLEFNIFINNCFYSSCST